MIPIIFMIGIPALIRWYLYIEMSAFSLFQYEFAILPVSMVSYQKGPTRHAYAWQIGPFWQDTLDIGTIGDKRISRLS